MTRSRSVLRIASVLIIAARMLSAQPSPIRVACVGNSITDGGQGSTAYPAQLGALLGAGYDVRNFGVGGTTLLKKGDFPYWNTTKYLDAKDFDPQILIIKLGTNDSKPQNWIYKADYFSEYMDLIGEFRKHGRRPQIYVCRPVPVYIDTFGITSAIVQKEMIPLIDSVRRMAGTCMIDFNAALAGHKDLFPDGIHPNASGYGVMAQTARDSILNSPAGIIRSFTASRSTIEQGESVTLYWETTRSTRVTINGIPRARANDSLVVSPATTTTYVLTTDGAVKDTSTLTIRFLPPGKIKAFTADFPFLDLGLGDSTALRWSATNGSTVFLDGAAVGTTGTRYVSPKATQTYTLVTAGVDKDSLSVTVQVLEPIMINRAFNKPATASSVLRGTSVQAAVDGESATGWHGEANSFTQWIMVDLGKDYIINRVEVEWGSVFATAYRVDFLTADSSLSGPLFANTAGDGGSDEKAGLNRAGRYFRLLAVTKNKPDSGVVVNEFRLYGRQKLVASASVEATFLPHAFAVLRNYPNPFNPSTMFEFAVPSPGKVLLRVFDVLGQEVATLYRGDLSAGEPHTVRFDASHLASGMYVSRLEWNGTVKAVKILLLQ